MFSTTLDPDGQERASQRSPRPEHGRTLPIHSASEQWPRREHVPPKSTPRYPQAPFNLGGQASSQLSLSSPHTRDMKLRGHESPGRKYTGPSPTMVATPFSRTLPVQEKPRQRNADEVVPLRKPLPAEVPAPSKPKRPPSVNLEPYMRNVRGDTPNPGRRASEPWLSTSGVTSPPAPPQRDMKPSRRQRASLDASENLGAFNGNQSVGQIESPIDNSTPFVDSDEDKVYEFDEMEEEIQADIERKENEYRKIFQLHGELEVLYTARVGRDWYDAGQLSLRVRQGENVEILRVTNTPRGTWLARSKSGNYGYISSTCVDVDYDTLKQKMLSRKSDVLPPPPPDPPQVARASSFDSLFDTNDDYDDVEPIPADFPPPPLDICIDPKTEKELRKKFKFEGPIIVLHTMMVDPNCTIKKPVGKQLLVTQGDVVDIIQQTNRKKFLCHNRTSGKYGYVPSCLLIPMNGGLYDDVDRPVDIYDNDLPSPPHRRE